MMNAKLHAFIATLACFAGGALFFSSSATAYTPVDACYAGGFVTDSVPGDMLLINSRTADFGGGPHVNGAPTGRAAVCWAEGRVRMALIGKLYMDATGLDPKKRYCARLDVRVFNLSGQRVATQQYYACNQGGNSTAAEVPVLVQVNAPNADLNRVRIQVFSGAYDCSAGACSSRTRWVSQGISNRSFD
ncbi:MAG: hypothetical protein K2Y51_10895 [Gammaproteobacteria bacterium]|jgi:hypothetical protein|nr:hypothetical protein [Gammaproteobacteria bacterium]